MTEILQNILLAHFIFTKDIYTFPWSVSSYRDVL